VKKTEMQNIISYELSSPDGPVIVGVGLLGLTLIQMPVAAAREGAVLQSTDVIEALVDADATLAQRYRQQLRVSEMLWLDHFLEELRDEIEVENQMDAFITTLSERSLYSGQQLELFNSDDFSVVVQQDDVGF
jgi:hypothetical protein